MGLTAKLRKTVISTACYYWSSRISALASMVDSVVQNYISISTLRQIYANVVRGSASSWIFVVVVGGDGRRGVIFVC